MSGKKIITIALLVFLPFFITACSLQDLPVIGKFFSGGGGSGGSSEPATLNVWGLWEKPEVVDVIVKKYQETHPNVTVNYDSRDPQGLYEYKERVYARATDDSAPDIMFVHNSWVPGLAGSLTTMPGNYMDAAGYSEKFYRSAVDSAVIGNQIYAVPLYYDGLVLVYNKKHFEERDQDAPPTSWEELRKLALDLTKRGDGNALERGGVAIGTGDNIEFAADILGLMFSQAKVSMPDELDKQKSSDAVRFYINFVTEDGVWNSSMPEASTAFIQGRVSMIFVPAWHLLDILTAAPDMEIGVAPVPQALEEARKEEFATWGSFWMGTVPQGSKNKEAAWEFLNFLVQEETQLLWHSEASKYREYGPIYSLKSLKDELSQNAYLKPLLDTADISKSGIMAARSGNKTADEAVSTLLSRAARERNVDGIMGEFKTSLQNTK